MTMSSLSERLKHHFLDHFGDSDCTYLSPVLAHALQDPHLVGVNEILASELQLDANFTQQTETLELLSGTRMANHIMPIAVVYSGHQFGVWAGQLGDGRAMTLGEISVADELWDIQLKGAGTTPYSRFGDGRAVLRSSIREYLCSEAMHALKIPTTRALSLFDSSTPVYRETVESAAILCRVARSHIRFGTFEHFYHRGQFDACKDVADYVLARHFSSWQKNDDRYLRLFRHVVTRTANTIAQWQAVGFAHGVMNTDNMSILGDTLDYGPFGFVETYNPDFICNHSDERGRYAFKNQPTIGLWNLNALATAFSALIPSQQLIEALQTYEGEYQSVYRQLMGAKLGLTNMIECDDALIDQLLACLRTHKIDYCLFFRALCDYEVNTENTQIRDLFNTAADFDNWARQYDERLKREQTGNTERRNHMRSVNPKYILRNYMAQQAITTAEQGDYSQVAYLLKLLQRPFDEHPDAQRFADHPPPWASELSVSCSS